MNSHPHLRQSKGRHCPIATGDSPFSGPFKEPLWGVKQSQTSEWGSWDSPQVVVLPLVVIQEVASSVQNVSFKPNMGISQQSVSSSTPTKKKRSPEKGAPKKRPAHPDLLRGSLLHLLLHPLPLLRRLGALPLRLPPPWSAGVGSRKTLGGE